MLSQTDASRRERLVSTALNAAPIVNWLQVTVVRYARGVQALLDRDIAAGLQVVLDTLRTETKGIIYEHRTSNLLAQGLASAISSDLKEISQKAEEKGGERLRIDPVIGALELALAELDYEAHHSTDAKAYLKTLIRKFPAAYATPRQEGGCIILASA